MLRMVVRSGDHYVRAENFIGPGCREYTDIHCLTCDVHMYDYGSDDSVHESIRQHVNSAS